MVGRLLVGFVWLNLQFSVSWLVDFQWGSCGSIFSFLCHGWQTFSGLRVAQSLVVCVMIGRLLVGFVWLNLQFSVSWLVDFQWVSVAQSLVFCVMVGRLLVGFVWPNLQLSVSWLVNFQWGSCGSIFSFLCHGRQIFSGLRVSQSFVFCVMVGRLLVGSCGSNFSFLCHGCQTFSGVRVAQSLVFCVMVGRLLVGFVWLKLQFSVSWLVDFQQGSCGSIFSFLCHGWQTFSGVRVAQSLVFCVMVGRLLVGFVWLNLYVFCVMVGRLLVGSVWLNLQFSVSWLIDFQWGSCGSIFSFLCHGRQTFSGVRVAQSLVFCVMVGRLLVGFVWLSLYFSVSWQVDFQWGSRGSIFSFLCHGWQTFSGFVWLKLQFSVSWLVDFQWGSWGSIFSFLCHGWQTFSGVRVAQSLVFCVMVGRLLVGFVWLNLQFSVSWFVDFQWGSCGSIFMFSVSWLVDFQWGPCGSIFSVPCHGWQTFSGVRVAQSLVFCVMAGRLLVGFVWLNLQFSVSWLVDFQWASCGSIFSCLCHDWQTFSGVRVAQSLVFCDMVGRLLVGSCGSNFSFLCHGWQTFSGVRVAQSLVFCVMVGRLLVGFVWLNLQFSVSWQVDFQWGSCGSIFSFLCHGWQTFSGVRVAQSLVFCVMVGRLLVGSVWLNLQFSVSWQVDFQWGSCGSIFSFLCHGWQTFSGVRVAQSLVFCDLVGRLLVSFVWLNLLFFVSWLVDFQWGSCGSIFSFLCHGWQTFSGVRVAQSLVFCVMVGRLLVGFVWLNLQLSVSWLVDFQWGSCGSIFSFLCHGRQTFRRLRVSQSLVFGVMVVDFQWVRVAQTLVFCVMVGRLLVGFVWLNLQFSVSWLVDFQWFRVAQTLVFCVMVGRLLVGFVWLNLQFSVTWLVDF